MAPGGLDLYTQADGVPGGADSLLLASLTRGAVYRLMLSPDHSRVLDTPTMEFKSTNRYRDLAIRPDGRVFYVATDNEGPTRDAADESTRELANPGAILEFSYAEGR